MATIANDLPIQKRNPGDPVPVTILTGFLGAGKTTLLNHLLSSTEHKMKFAVIENEFGDVGIDENILVESSEEQVIEIISNDSHVEFRKYKVVLEDNNIVLKTPKGLIHKFIYSNKPSNKIPWIGKVDLFLECSGKNTERNSSAVFLKEKTINTIFSYLINKRSV